MADSNSNGLFLTLFCSIFIIVGKAPAVAAGDDVEVCSENLNKFLPPPFSDLSNLSCSPIWEQKFGFRFFQDSNNVTTMVLSRKHENQWIGIAFSCDGRMVGSSAVVGWVGSDGISGIKQYALEGKTTLDVKPDKGDLQFTNAKPVAVVYGGIIYIAFQLQFKKSLALQPILMAIGNGNPTKGDFLPPHVDKLSTTVEFSPGHLSGRETSIRDLRSYHGTAAIIGWGILMPTGGLFARYFRHLEPSWYYLHSTTQFLGFFSGLIAISLGRNLYSQINAVFVAHRVIGFSVFLLAGLEVCQFVGRPSTDSKLRRYWNLGHHWIGRFTILLGITNVFVGFHGVSDVPLRVTFGIALSILVMLAVVFERRLRKENSLKHNEPPVFISPRKQPRFGDKSRI